MKARRAHLALVATLALAVPLGASAAPRLRILINTPRLVGNTNEASITSIYAELEQKIRALFPCATVRTQSDVRLLFQHNKDRRLVTGNTDEESEEIAELLGADLIINMEFGSTGTTHESPGRYLNATMFDSQRALTRSRADREGWKWSPHDFVEETLAPLRAKAYEVCPWLGTIDYVRKSETIKDTTEPRGVQNGTTSVYTTKTAEFEDEAWTFVLTRRHLKRVRIETKGKATMKITRAQKLTESNKNCFPQNAAGELSDTNLVTHVSDEQEDRQSSKGSAEALLLSPKVSLTRQEETTINGEVLKVPTWTLVVEAAFKGTSQSTSVSERRGGCGNWTRDHPEESGPAPYGRLVSFTIDRLRGDDTVLEGKVPLSDTTSPTGAHETESVTFKLTRK